MTDESTTKQGAPPRRLAILKWGLLAFLVLASGIAYFLWQRDSGDAFNELVELAVDYSKQQNQVTLPDEYTLPVTYGDIGPQLLVAGAINYEQFVEVYNRSGQPLTNEQQNILQYGSDEPIVINRENAYFLLNFFWAFGLTNQNAILDNGPLAQYADGDISNFASTGGWTIGEKSATELYSSTPIVELDAEQQALLETIAEQVYRPCCNNHTAFADCNHGMAMLGILEVMAAQDASLDEMFEAAKYLNAFWFPQQTMELALFFQVTYRQDFASIDAHQAVGATYFSATGFRTLHQYLTDSNLLQPTGNGGSSCDV